MRRYGQCGPMAPLQNERKLEMDLVAMLARKFPGLTVKVGRCARLDRKSVTFSWAGFADLLVEERFQRLAAVIPGTFRKRRLSGFVWYELSPSETLEEFLKKPRSEDMADQEGGIYDGLLRVAFFDALRRSLGSAPADACPGDFSLSARVLAAEQFSAAKIRDAKLTFIRHGVFCDCQVLETVQPALARQCAGAA